MVAKDIKLPPGQVLKIRPNGSRRVQLTFSEPSMTLQSEKDQNDINQIMANYVKTGTVPTYADRKPIVGDFSTALDYHSAMNAVIAAQDYFMSLPAQVRSKFENDPGKFLQFAEDPRNASEMVALGLAEAPQKKLYVDIDKPKGSDEGSTLAAPSDGSKAASGSKTT